jgi:hypothetical protein
MTMLLLLTLCAWIIAITAGQSRTIVANRWTVALIATLVAALSVAASAASEFQVSDRLVYVRMFRDLGVLDSPQQLSTETDFLFVWLLWVWGHVVPTRAEFLFGGIAVVLAAAYLFACHRVLPPWAGLAAWLTLVASGWFASYTVVAIRQGLAIACLMAAVGLVVVKNGRRAPLLALLAAAPLFHWSAVVPAVILAVIYLRGIPVRIVVFTWCALAVAFVLDLQQLALGRFQQQLPQMTEYLGPDAFRSYQAGGNRLDFLAVSAVFITIGLLGRRGRDADPVLDRLFVILVAFNCYFLIFGFVAFSDRIAAYSWFLAPMLTWYVLSKRNNIPAATTAIVAVVAFGLFGGTLAALASV